MRSHAGVLLIGSLAASAGTAPAADAQVTGTLQASATVVDDPVRDSLLHSLTTALETGGPMTPRLLVAGVAVRLRQLPAAGGRRRIRIEILY